MMTRRQETEPDAPGPRHMALSEAFQTVLELARAASIDRGELGHSRSTIQRYDAAIDLVEALGVGSFNLKV